MNRSGRHDTIRSVNVMKPKEIQAKIDELRAEAALLASRGERDRANILETAAKRVEEEFAREQARPTAMRFDRFDRAS